MGSIGHADLLIVPKFDGLSNAVNRALGNVNMSSSGAKSGSTFASGFKSSLTSGAVVGAVSAITSKAFDAITSHLGDAISRLDTLKNYPLVMQSLGVSAQEADASINMMSDRLQGLPTSLDTMASSVQGIYAATKDYGVSLSTATEAGLALNDMLLAGGQGMDVTNAAMEQFRQMLAKGKPEMQDWNALVSAAPGQMDQLAKSMLGPTANARDLYEAVGGGGNEATISMSQLLEAMIKLDKEGGAGLDSFQSQAQKATGGIETSMANMENAITRGLANVMDSIGRDRIAGVFNTARDAIDGFFGVVSSVAPVVADVLGGIAAGAADAAPALLGLTAGVAAFVALGPALKGITTLPALFSAIGMEAQIAAGGVKSAMAGLVSSFNPVTAGIALAAATLVYFGTQAMKTAAENEKMTKATTTLNDAVSRSTSLDDYASGISDIGVAAQTSKISMSDFYDSMQKHADAMQSNNQKAEETIATLNTVQGVMDEYAGKAEEGVTVTDLSAEAQGRLAFAAKEISNELGAVVTAEDILNGTYVDADGNVQNLTEDTYALIEARKQEARTEALTENLKEAYSGQAEAVKMVQSAQEDYNKALDAANKLWQSDDQWKYMEQYGSYSEFIAASTAEQRDALNDAEGALSEYNKSIVDLETEMGMAGTEAGKLKEAFMEMAVSSGGSMVAALTQAGVNIDELSTKLANAGMSTEQLSAIGADSFAALASACGGNVDAMVAILTDLDDLDIATKHFDVDDDGTIVFERSELTDLDRQNLRNKGFTVTDYGSSTRCSRDVRNLHGEIDNTPGFKAVTVEANVYGTQDVRDLVNAINSVPSGVTSIVEAVTRVREGATGAFVNGANLLAGAVPARGLYDRLKTRGSIKPLLHADGGIVDSPTLTSVGFVGENGAEAIVPLTNRQYVKPFAHVLAEEMGGMGGEAVIRWLDANLGPIIGAYAPTATPRELRRMNRKVATYA